MPVIVTAWSSSGESRQVPPASAVTFWISEIATCAKYVAVGASDIVGGVAARAGCPNHFFQVSHVDILIDDAVRGRADELAAVPILLSHRVPAIAVFVMLSALNLLWLPIVTLAPPLEAHRVVAPSPGSQLLQPDSWKGGRGKGVGELGEWGARRGGHDI